MDLVETDLNSTPLASGPLLYKQSLVWCYFSDQLNTLSIVFNQVNRNQSSHKQTKVLQILIPPPNTIPISNLHIKLLNHSISKRDVVLFTYGPYLILFAPIPHHLDP